MTFYALVALGWVTLMFIGAGIHFLIKAGTPRGDES